jgi:hypothetical protein
MNKKELINIGIFILMIIAICLLLFTVITLLKNKDIITSDPLSYGMKVHNFTSCSCFDSSGNNWRSTGSGFESNKINLKLNS